MIFLIVVFVYRIGGSEDHTEEIVCSSFAIKLVLNEGGLGTVPSSKHWNMVKF